MLGRKTYTQEEFDTARTAIGEQLAAYAELAAAVQATSDPRAASALAAFEPLLFNTMTLALDRYFVHRVRLVTGKDGNPLNEVELIADSLMGNGGVLRIGSVIKLIPEQSVLQLADGDPIRLSAAQFERLSAAFFGDLEAKFL